MIHVDGLVKDYGKSSGLAVDHISFDVRAGEVLGFWGPTAPARRRP